MFYQNGELKVEGAVNIRCLAEFYMKEQLNEHMYFRLKGSITEEDAKEYEKKKILGELIKISRVRDGEESCLGTGVLDHAKIRVSGQAYEIQMEGYSLSYRLTSEKKRRSFQNPEYTYEDVARRLSGSSIKAGYFEGRKQMLGYPFIQYDETDWEALCRLTGRFGGILVAEAQSGKISVISKAEDGEPRCLHLVHKPEVLMHSDRRGHRKLSLRVRLDVDLRLGEEVICEKRKWITAEKEVIFENGMLETQYLFGRTGDWKLPSVGNRRLQGVTLPGKVLRRKGERIKLWLNMDADQPEEGAYGYPYLPDTGNILYAMPEEGMEAALYFPDAGEQNGIIIHSFPGKESEKCTWNPSVKKLETLEGKKIKIWPEVMEITGGENRETDLICLGEKTGVQLASQKGIHIQADGKVKLESGLSCSVAAVSQIVVKQTGEKNKIELSGNQLAFLAEKYMTGSVERKSRNAEKGRENRAGQQNFSKLHGAFLGMMAQGDCGELNEKIAGGLPVLGTTRGDLSSGTQMGLRIRSTIR